MEESVIEADNELNSKSARQVWVFIFKAAGRKFMSKIKLKPSIYVNLAISIFTGVFAQLSMKYGMNGLKENIHLTATGSNIPLNLLSSCLKIHSKKN